MTAKKAIRDYCMWCVVGSYKEITLCPIDDCPIWPFKEGRSFKGESKQKAVKSKCEDCIQSIKTGMLCKEKKCPLFPYRDGHRPKNPDAPKRILSAEHIEIMQKKRKIKINQKSC